jgi:hypothetical protein
MALLHDEAKPLSRKKFLLYLVLFLEVLAHCFYMTPNIEKLYIWLQIFSSNEFI